MPKTFILYHKLQFRSYKNWEKWIRIVFTVALEVQSSRWTAVYNFEEFSSVSMVNGFQLIPLLILQLRPSLFSGNSFKKTPKCLACSNKDLQPTLVLPPALPTVK